MEKRNDGGPAFPHSTRYHGQDITETITDGGMSLRDWFAGQALVGELAAITSAVDVGRTAKFCFEIADAMLAERDKS